MTGWYDKTIQALIKVENNTVFFQYAKPTSRRLRTMSLNALEFIRRFLQHVLPTGFMNPNCSVPFEKVSTLIQMAYAFALEMPDYPERPLLSLTCPTCGGPLQYLASFSRFLRPPTTLDSS